MRDDSAEILFQSFLREAVVSSFGDDREVHHSTFPSSISSAGDGVAYPARCPEGWFWRGCRSLCDNCKMRWLTER